MHEVHGDVQLERLASISTSHIYHLRESRAGWTGHLAFRTTCPAPVSIGTRQRPAPDGGPVFLRVDTVDLGGREGRCGGSMSSVASTG